MGKFNLGALVSMEMPIDLILVVSPEPVLLEASPSTVMPGATKGTLHHLCLSILQRSGWRPTEA